MSISGCCYGVIPLLCELDGDVDDHVFLAADVRLADALQEGGQDLLAH